jgi:hypothetical protein
MAVSLAAGGAPVMPTLQAHLRRSPEDAHRLIAAKVPVLLVKGTTLEPRHVAYPWGEQTDVAFHGLEHELHDGGVRVAIGTHDPVLRETLLATLDGIGVEMLLGVRPETDATCCAAGIQFGSTFPSVRTGFVTGLAGLARPVAPEGSGARYPGSPRSRRSFARHAGAMRG